LKKAKAFAPGAISSFFEIHDTQDGKPIADLEKVGAVGGGFGLEKGVATAVSAQQAERNSINVFINSKPAAEAKTTRQVIETLLTKTDTKYAITVEHQIEVPIGTGFGTSAGGALTAGLALKEALG
jgi:pantoate kinase